MKCPNKECNFEAKRKRFIRRKGIAEWTNNTVFVYIDCQCPQCGMNFSIGSVRASKGYKEEKGFFIRFLDFLFLKLEKVLKMKLKKNRGGE